MNKTTTIILIVILVLVVAGLLPIFGERGSLLRRCKFDEFTGKYSKCFWIWDEALKSPSIYF